MSKSYFSRASRMAGAAAVIAAFLGVQSISAQPGLPAGADQLAKSAIDLGPVQRAAYADEVSRTPYEAQVLFGAFSCASGWCKAAFPKVGAKRRLEVKSMSCAFTSDGSYIDAQAEYQNTSGATMYLALASEWIRPNGGYTNATFGKQTNLFVPAGKTISAVVHISANLIGAHCQIFGDMVVLQ